MSKPRQNQIQPGLCPIDPDTGLRECPPFDRIECIVVEKVYDSCFQIDSLTREFETNQLGNNLDVGDLVECSLKGEIMCEEVSRTPLGDGFSSVTVMIKVPIKLKDPEDNDCVEKMFNFTKTVTLCLPSDEVMVNCEESNLISCMCIVTDKTGANLDITCDIQVCVVIKATLEVQLLVPSYGFCVPSPCAVQPGGICPPTPPTQCF